MPKSHRQVLYVSVESFHGLTELEPERGWENPLLRYNIRVGCKNCKFQLLDWGCFPLCLSSDGSLTKGIDGNEYHKPLTCPGCLACGGLRILKRGGKPMTVEGQEMPVMEVQVVGSFRLHKNIQMFYFRWISRKDDDSEDFVGPFYVDGDGSYVVWDSGEESDDDDERLQIKGLKGYFEAKSWEEKVEGLRIKEAYRLPQSDSDSSSEDSDD